MLAAIGPGRYRATNAATSSNEVGASDRISARIGPPSSWKIPIESARWSSSSVGLSSSGMASMSGREPVAHVDDPLDIGIGGVHLPQFGRRLVAVLELRILL